MVKQMLKQTDEITTRLEKLVASTLIILKKKKDCNSKVVVDYWMAKEHRRFQRNQQACAALARACEHILNSDFQDRLCFQKLNMFPLLYSWGWRQRAMELVKRLKPRWVRNAVYCDISKGLIQAQQFDKARKMIIRCQDEKLSSILYLDLAEQLHKHGKTAMAVKALETITTDECFDYPYNPKVFMAITYASIGYKQKARAILESFHDDLANEESANRWQLLMLLSHAYHNIGDKATASKTAKALLREIKGKKGIQYLIDNYPKRAECVKSIQGCLWIIGQQCAFDGLYAELDDITKILFHSKPSDAYNKQIAIRLIEANRIKKVESMLTHIKRRSNQLSVLIKLAGKYYDAGNRTKSKQILGKVAQQSKYLKNLDKRSCFKEISNELHRQNPTNPAAKQAMERAMALTQMRKVMTQDDRSYWAWRFAEIGCYSRALDLAETIEDPLERMSLLDDFYSNVIACSDYCSCSKQ